MEAIQLIQVTPEQLENRIVEKVKSALNAIVNNTPLSDEEKLLSITETAAFLGVSKVSIWDWTKKGKLKSYGLGSKVFYKKSELLEALTPLNK